MGIFFIIVALVVMTILAMKNVPILVASVVSGVIVLVAEGMNVLDGFTVSYMAGYSNYVKNYFLMFVLGALFGKICEIGGATDSIASAVVKKLGEKYIVLAIAIAAAILAFGGVNLFVALFALYPLAMSMFKKAGLPRRLFPGAYIVGAGTFAMTSPFTPSTQNIIPMAYLGTDLAAGMIPGLIGTVFAAVAGLAYMHIRAKKLVAAGETFEPLPGETFSEDEKDCPPLLLAILPMIILIAALNLLKLPVVTALVVGIFAGIICYFKWIPHDMNAFWGHISTGSQSGIMSLCNTAAVVGFGSIVTSTPTFAGLADMVREAAEGGMNPYVMVAIAVTLLAGISGSASGGLGIAVPICADIFLPLGVNAGALHRISVVASSGLDSLPHNGFVNTCLQYSKCTHKSSYLDIFVVSVLITLVELALVVVLFSLGM